VTVRALAEQAGSEPGTEPFYTDGFSHLADELEKLELLLRLRVASARRRWAARPDSTGSPLCVSDAEVDWLLGGETLPSGGEAGEEMLRLAVSALRSGIGERVAGSARRGVSLPLPRLAERLGLSDFEADALLVCLAPELRRRYDRVYAYLQDDVTRLRPSVDLVLDLLCDGEAERWAARAWLAPTARLFEAGILQPVDDPQSPSGSSGLARMLRLDPRILHFLLGHGGTDARLDGRVQLLHPADADEPATDAGTTAGLLALALRAPDSPGEAAPCTVLHLHGPRGVGRRETALAVCGALGRPLLALDAERLPAHPDEAEALLRLALRESALLRAPLYVVPAEALLREGDGAAALRRAFARTVERYDGLVFLGGESPWPHAETFAGAEFHSVALPVPGAPAREAAWTRAIRASLPGVDAGDAPRRLAERFRLTPGRIREAAADFARHRVATGDEGEVGFEALAAACRARSQQSLGGLATKVKPRYAWGDLVLPDDKLDPLRELCDQARNAWQVYERWGFGRKLPRGRGLSALFSGPPGTGKTMAAEVLAAELQLDLYKVDLATVVSKYIGETEKNLSRIFAEAEDGNSILFFDEADALFGKRTEVSDAHDRYANIETSYLLQRMEEYAGMVILASNLRENMDEAFLRRIRFVVDFPFPDAASRLRIWKGHFPAEAPMDDTVDYGLLAERVQVAGGNIKNIALHAAFLAAAEGSAIGFEHVLKGARREFEKIGKLWDEAALRRARR